MNDLLEVILTSDDSGTWNTSVWDPNTSTMVMHYKGGNTAAPHTLSLISNDFVIAADKLKPLLYVWPINSQEPVQGLRLVCPGRVLALDISSDGIYCAAGIAEKLHIWHLSTGRLFAVISRHYQPITCVKFTDDGNHVITAGQDGLILVWNLSYLIQQSGQDEKTENPLYSFSDHTLPITDIFVGKGGLNTRLLTVSTDRTCRIYDLSNGTVLNSVIFKCGLTSVAMDNLEQTVFVGDTEGTIFQFYLCSAPTTVEGDTDMRFLAHDNAISCISTSADGQTLMSGGKDNKIILWHIPSRKVIRTILLKGAVTNAFYAPVPHNMFMSDFKPPLLSPLAKTIEISNEIPFVIEVMNNDRSMFNSEDIMAEVGETEYSLNSIDDKTTIKKLEKINHELYTTAVQKILGKHYSHS